MDVEVIVETPQGSRNKYKIDPKSGRIRLDRMLFTSTVYPLDYGKIPDTLAEDGDPLDMLIWLDEPTFPGCLVTVRPVAVFWMADERGPDAKLLGVASHDVRKSRIRDLEDVPRHLLNEIGHFFDIYKELEPGKSTDVRGWMDRAEAERVIKEAESPGEQAARAGRRVRIGAGAARRLPLECYAREILSYSKEMLFRQTVATVHFRHGVSPDGNS